MRRIIIRNIGALEDVDIRLSDINVIIGPQSLGKSTLLKICSYCAWVEKRIQLSQDYSAFANSDLFYQRLVVFHKLDHYFRKGGIWHIPPIRCLSVMTMIPVGSLSVGMKTIVGISAVRLSAIYHLSATW